MKNTNYLLAFILLAVFSCTSKNTSEHVGPIDLEKTEGPLLLSNIADSISYIKLETSDSCLLYNIRDIKYQNGIFYIQSNGINALFLFDEKGHFLSKFNKNGQGPEEYVGIQKFDVDSHGGIHILDEATGRIMKYGVNGELQKSYRYSSTDFPRDFCIMGNDYLLSMPDENIGARCGLFYYHVKENKYQEISSITGKKAGILSSYFTPIVAGVKVGVFNVDSCEMCYIENGKLSSSIEFDIPLYTPTWRTSEPNKFALAAFRDIGHYLLLSFGSDNKGSVYVLYNKTNHECHVYDSELVNDFDSQSKPGYILKTISWEGKHLLCLNGQLDANGEEMNPILQVLHLKK